jgi:predicted Zn-dependent protease
MNGHKKYPIEFENEFNKAITQRDTGQYNLAIETFVSLQDKFPNEILPYVFAGEIYLDINEIASAIKNFKIAVQLNPRSEMASLGLFHSLWESGNTTEAFNEISRYLTDNNHSKKYKKLITDIINEFKIDDENDEYNGVKRLLG